MNKPPYGDALKRENAHLGTLKVSAQMVPDMTVYISSGAFWSEEVIKEYSGGNSPTISAPGSDAKFIIVTLNWNSNIQLVEGIVSADPVVPDLPARVLPLAVVYIRNTDTTITDDMVYDQRPVLFIPSVKFAHNYLSSRDATDAHTVGSVTDLQTTLDDKVGQTALTNALAVKADQTGTDEVIFSLNKAHTGVATSNCALRIERGSSIDVDLTWVEAGGANRWKIDYDFLVDDTTKGIILKSPDGTLYRLKVADGGALSTEAV